MKKILALMLILALCFSLVAFAVSCNEPDAGDEGGSTTPPAGDDGGDGNGDGDGDGDGSGDGGNGGDEGGNQGNNSNTGVWLPID